MNDILIVGAGPVGLVMAAELARHGIRPRIIEQSDQPSTYCKALGISTRTLEVFEDMGISNQFADAGIWLQNKRVIVGDYPSKDSTEDLSDLPYATLCLPQPETERILTKHLSAFGINIERGTTLTAFEQDVAGVEVELQKDNQIQKCRFRYVIGCDGAHSVVRKQAGISFEGQRMPYDFILADVHIDWDLPSGYSLQVLHPVKDQAPDFMLAIPLPELNRYRISMLAGATAGEVEENAAHGIQQELPAPSLAEYQLKVNHLLPGQAILSDMRWSSVFRISMRIAGSYRKQNVFIAGDAAHIHPPTGGQGMNTGIQDAYNLAWKMALVIKSAAPESLLDSYDPERREEGLNVIERTSRATISAGKEGFKLDRLEASQVNVNYRNSPWVVQENSRKENEPIAGDRAPDCQGLRRQGLGFPFRLFDFIKGIEHILLVYAGTDFNKTVEKLDAFKSILHPEFGAGIYNRLRIAIIGSDTENDYPVTEYIYLPDKDGQFKNTYAADQGDGWLIRPDGYIGWNGSDLLDISLQSYLFKIFSKAGNLTDRG